MKNLYLPLLVIISLSGCSYFQREDAQAEADWTVERIYAEANAALNIGDYTKAVQYYDQLEARFPFGEYAQQALLESAFAHYKKRDSEIALATIDRFIRVYPLNPNMDYAIYLRGLINFHRGMGFLDQYIPRDETQRDPAGSRDALRDFTNLVSRYPTSRYSEDATQRIVYLRNRLAQHEIHVAQYYMRRTSYLAALNRAKYVVENFPRTTAMPEALVIMAKAYKIMDFNDLAEDTLRVLELNYPGHPGVAEVRRTRVN